jgi:hypothetical protein
MESLSIEEMADLITELTSGYTTASGMSPAYDMPPRKDYGPAGGDGYPPNMNKKGLLDPYQSHPYATQPDAPRPPHIAYPLETTSDHLSDAYLYLATALKQIEVALIDNKALSTVQKQELSHMYEEGKLALQTIQNIGNVLIDVATISY